MYSRKYGTAEIDQLMASSGWRTTTYQPNISTLDHICISKSSTFLKNLEVMYVSRSLGISSVLFWITIYFSSAQHWLSNPTPLPITEPENSCIAITGFCGFLKSSIYAYIFQHHCQLATHCLAPLPGDWWLCKNSPIFVLPSCGPSFEFQNKSPAHL